MPRKQLGKIQSHWRIEPETKEALDQIAQTLGYKYGTGGAVGEMLDAIAKGDLLLSKNVLPQRS